MVEAGTHRPIVSGPSAHSNDVGPDPIEAGSVHYFPLANNTPLRAAGTYFAGFDIYNWDTSAAIAADGTFRMAVPPGPGVILVSSTPGFIAGRSRGWDLEGVPGTTCLGSLCQVDGAAPKTTAPPKATLTA